MTDDALRVFIYDELISGGRAPSSGEIATRFGVDPADVRARLAALNIGKTVLVDERTHEIRMAGPFAARPSAHTLSDGKMTWWANCAWDMFGVAILVGRTLSGRATCSDCGDTLMVPCDPDVPPAATVDAVVHFLLPARRWYDDIGFT
jgi:hypothetical protein